jgi:hypothetical protein
MAGLSILACEMFELDLGASQLPQVCWKGCVGRVGRGRDGETLLPLLHHPIIQCSA